MEGYDTLDYELRRGNYQTHSWPAGWSREQEGPPGRVKTVFDYLESQGITTSARVVLWHVIFRREKPVLALARSRSSRDCFRFAISTDLETGTGLPSPPSLCRAEGYLALPLEMRDESHAVRVFGLKVASRVVRAHLYCLLPSCARVSGNSIPFYREPLDAQSDVRRAPWHVARTTYSTLGLHPILAPPTDSSTANGYSFSLVGPGGFFFVKF